MASYLKLFDEQAGIIVSKIRKLGGDIRSRFSTAEIYNTSSYNNHTYLYHFPFLFTRKVVHIFNLYNMCVCIYL